MVPRLVSSTKTSSVAGAVSGDGAWAASGRTKRASRTKSESGFQVTFGSFRIEEHANMESAQTLAMKAGAILILGLAASLWMVEESDSREKRGPSTPKERSRAVKLVRELEEDPHGAEARAARRWLSLWLVEVPDMPVDLCPELFGGKI